MLSVADLDSDAPNTAIAETSAIPTISADAVWAVRRRAAHRVLPAERPGDAEQPGDRSADHARDGSSRAPARPWRRRRRCRPPRGRPAGWPVQRARCRGRRRPPTASAEPAITRRRSGTSWRPVTWVTAAMGGMRTARRAGLTDATIVTPTPTSSATSTVLVSNTSGPVGRSTPNPRSSASRPVRGEHAEPDAEERGDEPDDRRLAEHGQEHLASARTHHPQQRELLGALAHEDRERVHDREPADEQRDEREDEQRGREEGERVVDGARLLVDHGLGGDDLHAVGEHGGDGALHRRLVRARARRRR